MKLPEMLQVKRGVTYVELIIVIALIAMIVLMTVPFSIGFINKMNTYSVKDKIISSLRKAQLYSIDNKDDQVWGVCLYNSEIRFYSGSCNSPVKKEDYFVPSTISLTGLSDFSFSSYLGEPNTAISIQIEPGTGNQITINMNEAGGLDVN